MLNRLKKGSRLVSILALTLPAFADGAVIVEPAIVKSTYCSSPNGDVTLWISLVVKYKNSLGQRVILPMPSRVAGYDLFSDEEYLEMERPLRTFYPRVAAMFDPSKIDRSQPDSTLFEVVEPDGVAQRLHNVHLLVRGPSVRPLPAGDYYLRVRIDPWPANRKSGETLAQSWKERGKLWIDPITLPPVRLRIEETPVAEPCPLRVD